MSTSHFHTQSWTSDSSTTTAHPGYPEMHQHLDDNSHLFDEMIQSAHLAAAMQAASQKRVKAKVLFQFFDGWPMPQS